MLRDSLFTSIIIRARIYVPLKQPKYGAYILLNIWIYLCNILEKY